MVQLGVLKLSYIHISSSNARILSLQLLEEPVLCKFLLELRATEAVID